MKFLNPVAELQDMSEVFNNSSGRFTKKIHSGNKEDSINEPGNNDPFPEFMLRNETMGFSPGLDAYYNFFKQELILRW